MDSKTNQATVSLKFHGGLPVVLLAPIIFILGAILNLLILHVFDIQALVAAGFVALMITALFAKTYSKYWSAALSGITSPASVNLVLILLAVSLIAALLDKTRVSSGFIWLASQIGIGGNLFVPVTFVLVCLVAAATGSSLGTLFTAFPVFFPAGIELGASSALLAGAILSGCLFGDNIAPISDSTIVSATTQMFRKREGTAEVGEIVKTRLKYSLTAAGVAVLAFAVAGALLDRTSGGGSASVKTTEGDPLTLYMLIPVFLLLYVAIRKKDIFLAVTIGVLSGVVVGLLSGNLTWAGIVSVDEENGATGFLADGINNMLPLIGLSIVVFSMIGTFTESGLFDRIVGGLQRAGVSKSPMKAELFIFLGSIFTTGIFASINGPAMLMFGPVADKIGAEAKLHPYRRSNVMDCGALGLGSAMPVVSTFLLIASQLTSSAGSATSAITIFAASFYPIALTATMLVAVLTGWGRAFEGENGKLVRSRKMPVASD
jgi:Na+/H+ antiporter NhaC